jgi:hypothetical protein
LIPAIKQESGIVARPAARSREKRHSLLGVEDGKMKKFLLACATLASVTAFLAAKNPPRPANFSGNWELDTNQTKSLPQGLESYTLAVKQSNDQLDVQSTLKGDLQQAMPNRSDTSYPGGENPGTMGRYPGGGYPGGMGMPRSGGMGMPMPGGRGPMSEGMPGGGMPGGRGGGGRRSGMGGKGQVIAAFKLYPTKVAYKLDGSDTSAKLGNSDQSDATAKANWEKGGKEIKLSLSGDDTSDRRGEQVRMKDTWKLSKDGQTLKIDRTVQMMRGSTTVHLVFRKVGEAPRSKSAS